MKQTARHSRRKAEQNSRRQIRRITIKDVTSMRSKPVILPDFHPLMHVENQAEK